MTIRFNQTKPTYFVLIFLMLMQFKIIKAQNKNSIITPIAYSNPISDISIDGKIDDWPNDREKHLVEKALWNGKNNGDDDFSGYFMSGYNKKENALYLAIVAKDNELVLGTKDDNIDYLDAYILYLNEQYKKKGSGTTRYIIAEYQNKKMNTEGNWDPKLESLSTWNNITYKTENIGTQRIYEIKIILDEPIYEGRVIGIGHLIDDKDSDKLTSYGWVNQPKYFSAKSGNLGMLVFNKDNKNLGKLTGRVSWNDTIIKNQQPEGVYIHSKSNNKHWFYFPVNRTTGHFEATLPSGDYILKPGKSAFFNGNSFYKADTLRTLPFKIEANRTTKNINYKLFTVAKPNLEKQMNLLDNLNTTKAKRQIDKVINTYMDYYQIEGLSFAAFKGDKITYAKGYGVKNNYTKEKVDENTLFEAASITKTVFAYAVLRLYEKGIIDLDEQLYNHLPFEYSSNTTYNKLLTARMILSHKSGLPNWRFSNDINYKFKPGKSYGYSGEGFEYLKRVLEKITNKNINDILNEEVVLPLELENMYFKKDEFAMQNKSHGHSNTFTIMKNMPSKTWVAFSLATNPKSLAKFLIALENRKGLKSETFDMMFSKQTSVPEDTKSNIWNYNEYMGLGFFIEEAPYGKVIRHSGDNGGFRAIFRLYDDLDMGYIITTNGNSGRFVLDNIERSLVNPEKLPKHN
jgi:CubicO group peptidase (beta-lactamase class C family)